MSKNNKFQTSIAVNIIGVIIILLMVFSVIVCTIGYTGFTEAFKQEYAESTYHMADTATTLINGDNLTAYLAGQQKDEYEQIKNYLDLYCKKIHVTMMYLIVVDTSDYGRFQSVFNPIDNSVEDTDYKEWELGFKRDTTNEEYRQKYKEIYENGSLCETVYRFKTTDGQKPHITTMVPVKNTNDEVVGILCMHRMMSELDDVRDTYLLRVGLTVLGYAVLFAVYFAIYSKKKFVVPLQKVSSEAMRFAKENTKGEPLGKISRFKELHNLASSVETMETDMLRYIDNLTAITAEKERVSEDLSIASTIQENSVPNTFPAFPERNDFDVYASMTPAKEVGGDFYNFFLVDDDHLAMVIADVSGKGIPAALFMMVSNILICDRTYMGGTPSEILAFVNDNICAHNKADMFVTVWLGILEISTGIITAVNAGHDDPAVCRKGGNFELMKTKHGLAVGIMPGIKYKDFEIRLNKGDKLFLYTDGLPEATDSENRMFSINKMIDTLNKSKENSLQKILDDINQAVDEFAGDAPQFDDLTMLCFELKENGNEKSIETDAVTDNLHQVISFVDEFLEENDCPLKAQMQIDLAVEEIFVNVANYAYGDETGKAEIIVSKEQNEVTIVIKDSGTPYNPLEKKDPDVTLAAEDRQIGGLGIFLTKKNMDSVSYRYENNQNVLTMTKKI